MRFSKDSSDLHGSEVAPNSSTRSVSAASEANYQPETTQYQIGALRAEVDFLKHETNPLAWKIYTSPLFQFLTGHIQNFSWTLERLRMPLRVAAIAAATALPEHPRVLLDMSETFRYGNNTGIQRVVREITNVAAERGNAIPVVIGNRGLTPYYRYAGSPRSLDVAEGDILVLLDSVWSAGEAYLPVLQDVSKRGGRIVLGLHDLIPITHPGVIGQATSKALAAWIERALPLADGVVTVSKNAAQEICDYIVSNRLIRKPQLGVGWFHLGANFTIESTESPSSKLAELGRRGPFFLSVGTLEPRKAYPVALAAFERLWNSGVDTRYVIIGKYGWDARALRDQILRHREYGRRLFWFENASDADVQYAYRHATALIFPSFVEGFGLPLIEAARAGLPVIASNIPVFREIGGDHLTYFDVLDDAALTDKISAAIEGKTIAPSFPFQTWQEATDNLLRLVRTSSYQFTL